MTPRCLVPIRFTQSTASSRRRGMSLVEILTVIGVIAVLIAILLPGLATARKNAIMAKSQNNMRQIATFLTVYAQAHRETIVPAAFDYSGQLDDSRMKARTGGTPPVGVAGVGSWADILWTENKFGPLVDGPDGLGWDWRYDAPDRPFYDGNEDYDQHPFRSAVALTKTSEASGTSAEAVPYGVGTSRSEIGHPGYFAANDFFDVRPPDASNPTRGKYWVTGQIVRPTQSVYLTDSFAGEVMQTTGTGVDNYQWGDVDYRYVGEKCLMLFLDGHVSPEDSFESLRQLEEARQIRTRDLDKQKPFFQ